MTPTQKRIDDVINDPEKVPPSSRSLLQRAAVFAKRARAAMPYHPEGDVIYFKDLKGKPVEYVDHDSKIRVKRCLEVQGLKKLRVANLTEATKNGKPTGKKVTHWIRVEQVVGAFARKGTNYRQEVVFNE